MPPSSASSAYSTAARRHSNNSLSLAALAAAQGQALPFNDTNNNNSNNNNMFPNPTMMMRFPTNNTVSQLPPMHHPHHSHHHHGHQQYQDQTALHKQLLEAQYKNVIAEKLAILSRPSSVFEADQVAAQNFLINLSSALEASASQPNLTPGNGNPLGRVNLSNGTANPLQDKSWGAAQTSVTNPLTKPNSAADSVSHGIVEQFTKPHKGYLDASVLSDELIQNVSVAKKKRTRGGGVHEPFPQKLHRMFTDLEEEQPEALSSVIGFLPHGRAFMIHNPQKFVEEIMPKYFRMSRFSSFQRQLNLYDFERVTDGIDKGAYYHELFLKGRPALSLQMKRTKIKGAIAHCSKGHYKGAGAINFYEMPPIVQNPQPSSGKGTRNAKTK